MYSYCAGPSISSIRLETIVLLSHLCSITGNYEVFDAQETKQFLLCGAKAAWAVKWEDSRVVSEWSGPRTAHSGNGKWKLIIFYWDCITALLPKVCLCSSLRGALRCRKKYVSLHGANLILAAQLVLLVLSKLPWAVFFLLLLLLHSNSLHLLLTFSMGVDGVGSKKMSLWLGERAF